MKITILCVGKIKEKYFTMAIDEYAKRLSRYVKLDIVVLICLVSFVIHPYGKEVHVRVHNKLHPFREVVFGLDFMLLSLCDYNLGWGIDVYVVEFVDVECPTNLR